jgi:ATP phosphoribosyltransferase regulatory subunit
MKIDDNIRQMLMKLAELNGDENVIQRARECLSKANAQVHKAIDYLEKTADLVKSRFDNIILNFDLAELHGYHYQTGVVFAAFVPQLGGAIARGGRYDDIGQIFGRARAATGFSTDLKLLDSLSKREYKLASRVFAPISDDAGLRKKIDELRSQTICVVEQLPGQSDDAAAMGCDRILKLVDGLWQVIDYTGKQDK